MGKCMICGVETIGNICRRCEEHNRREWCRDYERRAAYSSRSGLAAQYREGKLKVGLNRGRI